MRILLCILKLYKHSAGTFQRHEPMCKFLDLARSGPSNVKSTCPVNMYNAHQASVPGKTEQREALLGHSSSLRMYVHEVAPAHQDSRIPE